MRRLHIISSVAAARAHFCGYGGSSRRVPLLSAASNAAAAASLTTTTPLVPLSAAHGLETNVQFTLRTYTSSPATAAAAASECWNCKQTTPKREHMICVDCGHLQDVVANINYFELLQFPTSFTLEQQTLTKRFRQLQTLVHPDKFSNKKQREQTNSADWSSLINKAYKTLSAPIERGQYLLRLHGQEMPQDNSALDKEFLMEMMERNEEVEDTKNGIELLKMYKDVQRELELKIKQLGAYFDAKNLDAAKSLLVEMKYLISIQNNIKQKLES